MTHVQTRHIEGVFTATGAVAKRALSIPLLPKDGAWSITGHLTAVDQATPRHAVTFFPRFSGTCAAGVVTLNHPTKMASPQREGGQTWTPGGIGLTATGQQLEIEVTGIEDKTIVWAWSLDVVVISLPEQAPSDDHCRHSAE